MRPYLFPVVCAAVQAGACTDAEVNMIHVVFRNFLGLTTGEIIIGSARSSVTR